MVRNPFLSAFFVPDKTHYVEMIEVETPYLDQNPLNALFLVALNDTSRIPNPGTCRQRQRSGTTLGRRLRSMLKSGPMRRSFCNTHSSR
jgi:hypothetical protein